MILFSTANNDLVPTAICLWVSDVVNGKMDGSFITAMREKWEETPWHKGTHWLWDLF